MSRQISEQGGDAALKKRIRQAVYDIRYKARKDELDLRHAYSQYIGKSGLDQTGKEAVQNKLFGKSQQAESNVLEAASSNKYKVRVSDKETGKTYIRYAKRGKINKLRTKGSVEMTGHGSPKGAKYSPSVKKKGKKKLSSIGPEPKKIVARKKVSGKVASPKKPVPVQIVDPKKTMEKENTPDAIGSAVRALRKVVRKEAFIADAAVVAPSINKKITGEKVDNSKLIKVFPQDGSDPQIGSIKSSYKPVGEVVAEIVNPQQVDEVVGQAVGGLLGATAGKGLAKTVLGKVAGAATKMGAPAMVGKALTSKAAPKIAGAAVGAAAGEVLDPFKKNKDKNPVAAAVGGGAGAAVHGAISKSIKSSYKPVGEVVSEILSNEAYTVTNADKKGNTPAYQAYKAGKKNVKTGAPLYKAAPHMEEGKKADKDYDGDGKIESGTSEYMGSKDKAIKKAIAKEEVGVSTGSKMNKAKKEAKLQSKEQGAVKKAKRWQDNDGDGKWYEPGVDVKKEEFADPFYKQVEYDDEDPRSMKTKWNLVKNRLRSLGLKMSHELEGDTLEESEKVAQGAYKRAQELGAKRRSSSNPRGIGKNERAGYNLSQSARSRNASLETQGGNQTGGGSKDFGFAKNKSNPVKSKSVGDTGATGHYKKRDEKVTSKSGKTTRYKMKFRDRMDAPVSKRQELKDPKKNPKHTANEEVVQEADSLSATVDRWEAARQKRMKQRQSYERPSWIPRDQDHEDSYGSSKGEKKKPQNEHHQVDAKGKVIEHSDGTPSSVEEGIIGKVAGKVAGGVVGGVENLAVGTVKTAGKVAGSVVKRTGRAAAGAVKGALSSGVKKEGYVCESNVVRDILTKKN